jgi:hypothetical protein
MWSAEEKILWGRVVVGRSSTRKVRDEPQKNLDETFKLFCTRKIPSSRAAGINFSFPVN